jgi:RNA polymerase sigma factor (TIGR02999 family)
MVSDSHPEEKPEAGVLTGLLRRMQGGDSQARDQAVELVYSELHRIASRELRREHKGHTLQTTALIHEAYLELAGAGSLQIQDRGHFFAIASQQMRRILVDAARSSGAQKRGGGAIHVDLEGLQIGAGDRSSKLLQLDDALGDLERLDRRAAQVVELKYFGGYTDKEVAEALGLAIATIRRDWEFARSWLSEQMDGRTREGGGRKHVAGTSSSGS